MPATDLPERPRLTEEQKKQNHIRSEQKRREAIRDGFDRIASIVPGMQGQGRSEAVVLEATLDYMQEQIQERRLLIEAAKARGIDTRGWELEAGVEEAAAKIREERGQGVKKES